MSKFYCRYTVDIAVYIDRSKCITWKKEKKRAGRVGSSCETSVLLQGIRLCLNIRSIALLLYLSHMCE